MFPFPEERIFQYQAMQGSLQHLAYNPFEAFTQQELASNHRRGRFVDFTYGQRGYASLVRRWKEWLDGYRNAFEVLVEMLDTVVLHRDELR